MTRAALQNVALLLMFAGVACRGPRETEGRCDGEACPSGCEAGRCGSSCQDGARECHAGRVAVCRLGGWVERACDIGCLRGACVECQENAARCVDGIRRACDGSGRWSDAPCPVERPVCVEGGCVACAPGTVACAEEDVSEVCSDRGEPARTYCPYGCDPSTGGCRTACPPLSYRCDGRVVQRCDAEGGEYEEVERCADDEACAEGECYPRCDHAVQQQSPYGCRFFAPPIYKWNQSSGLGSTELGTTQLRLVNIDTEVMAEAVVRWGAEMRPVVIPPGADVAVDLDDVVRSADLSVRTSDAAIEVTSDIPISVVQHLHIANFSEDGISGDAAFLLPFHLLASYGQRYRVLTQPHRVNHWAGGGNQPGGFIVLSASDQAATLDVSFFGHVAAGDGVLPYRAGTQEQVPLGPREAIHFLSDSPGSICHFGAEPNPCVPTPGDDLTGTLIVSDQPIAVFNGGMSRIPWVSGAHNQTQLLEQIMPVALWGDGHTLAARRIPGRLSNEQWVVMTDTADTGLTFHPSPGASPGPLANPGDATTFDTNQGAFAGHRTFHLESSAPVLIGRYYYTRGAAGPDGGSTFTFERPTRFWRSDYRVVSVGGADNRLLLIVPSGAIARLDGVPLFGPLTPGPPGYDLIDVAVGATTHSISAPTPVGVLVYGHDGGVQNVYSYAGPVGFGDL